VTSLQLPTIMLLILCAPLFAQTSEPTPDVRTFEISATAPPTPSLKYEFQYDIASERLPGNGAQLYQDAILVLGPKWSENAEKALNASAAKDMNSFQPRANTLENRGFSKKLDPAARRENCVWEPPLHEMGPQTLLPHLEPLAHGLTRWTKARALRQ